MVERDADLLIASVERYRQGPRAFDRALACECAAEALSERSPSDAVALLEESLTVFGPAGALRDVARVEARLRALGVRRGKRGARRRPKAGWESLTETELRVSSLVQEGLSYREVGQRLFISKRTVETHVAHVFGKLGLSSRRELAEEVRNRTS
jgi:DNA-binding CsgD family transcriptional regulator